MNNSPIGRSPFVPPLAVRSPFAQTTTFAAPTAPADSLERGPALAPLPQMPRFEQAPAASGRTLRNLATGVALGLSLLAGAAPALAQAIAPTSISMQAETVSGNALAPTSISEEMESQIVGGKNQPGKLVEIFAGNPEKGTTFTVHGINGSPSTIDTVNRAAAEKGGNVRTFAYDDHHRELELTSKDLADNIAQWRQENPGSPLHLTGHSMGTRVILGALSNLQERGLLEGAAVDVTLIAPPLGGYPIANMARTAPGFLDGLISGLAPGRGMGTTSSFQRNLESMNLPDNVKTTIVLAETDPIVDSRMEGFSKIAQRIGARFLHVGGSDHISVLEHLPRAQPMQYLFSDGTNSR